MTRARRINWLCIFRGFRTAASHDTKRCSLQTNSSRIPSDIRSHIVIRTKHDPSILGFSHRSHAVRKFLRTQRRLTRSPAKRPPLMMELSGALGTVIRRRSEDEPYISVDNEAAIRIFQQGGAGDVRRAGMKGISSIVNYAHARMEISVRKEWTGESV